MANTSGEKELKTDWPITEGLTAGTTRQTGKRMDLEIPESKVWSRDKAGFT